MNIKYEQRLYEKAISIKYHMLSGYDEPCRQNFEVKTKTLIKMTSNGWPLFYKNWHLAYEVIRFPVEQVVELLENVDASLNNNIVTQDHYKILNILTENLLSRQSASCVVKEKAIQIRHKYNLGFDCLYEPQIKRIGVGRRGIGQQACRIWIQDWRI